MRTQRRNKSGVWVATGRSLEALECRRLLAAAVEIEPNETLEMANDLGIVAVEDIVTVEHDEWTAVEGEITSVADVDFFTFELLPGARAGTRAGVFFDIDAQLINTPTPEFVPTNNLNTQITLFRFDNGMWVPIAQNDDGYDFEGFITPTIPDYVDIGFNIGGTSLRNSVVAGQLGSKNVFDSSMYVELEPGQYALQVEGLPRDPYVAFPGPRTTGTYELRILADTLFSDTPPVLHSFTGINSDTPVRIPDGPNPPNSNLLFLDFTGEFKVAGERDDFMSFDFDTYLDSNGERQDGQLNDAPYEEILAGVDPVTGEPVEAVDYFTKKDRKDEGEFSPAERLAIKNIWSIVAEDLKAFDINVTTRDLTSGRFLDGESFRMLVTSYRPDSEIFEILDGFPESVDDEGEFERGFPTLMGAAVFDSWAEGGGDIWPLKNPASQRNDQLGYIFAANHNTFTDVAFGDTPNSGRIMAQPVQIANTISMQFGQALGMRKFLFDGVTRHNFIMQETYRAGRFLGSDRWENFPFPFIISHDLTCPSGGSSPENVRGGTGRPHDNPNGPHSSSIGPRPFTAGPFWEGGLDLPHRLTMGLNRVTWGQGRPCDWESLEDRDRVQNDVARIIGLNDPEDQGAAGLEADNTIDFRKDDFGSILFDLLTPVKDFEVLRDDTAIDGVIDSLVDLDLFKFKANRDGRVTIKADVNEYINNLDVVLRVFELDGRDQMFLFRAAPVDSFDALIELDLVRGKEYLVEVSGTNTAENLGSELGGYELQITFPAPPLARNDQVTTDEGVALTIPILNNDDPGDDMIDPASVQLTSMPTHGILMRNGMGVITYTPDPDDPEFPNWFGTDTFTYTVDNTIGGTSNVATVTVIVVNTPDAPIAMPDSVVTNQGDTIDIDVLSNDEDPDDPLNVIDPSTVFIVRQASDGTATANADGTVTYVPDAEFFGFDSFTYRVGDTDTPSLNSLPGTVTVRVNPRPIAVPDTADTDEDVAVDIDVLNNDFDPPPEGDLDESSVTIISHPTHGEILLPIPINPLTGAVRYKPDLDYNGTDSFTYTIDDIDGATSLTPATVNITILSVNDPPVAENDFFGSDAIDVPLIIPVLANDKEVDFEETVLLPGSIEIIQPASNGTVKANPDGTVTYTPKAGFIGGDSFTYRVFDNGSTIPGGINLPSNEAEVSVRVGQSISISGYVYIDFNQDGIRQPDELKFSDAMVRIERIDGPSITSYEPIPTVNGFYELKEEPDIIVPAGVYQITQFQPDALIDGGESVGVGTKNPPGDPVVVGNDFFGNLIMNGGAEATEFNFGELGLRASFVVQFLGGGRFFLASSGPDGIAMVGAVLTSIDLTAGDVLVSLPEGWEETFTASAVLSSTSSDVTIELIKLSSGEAIVLSTADSSDGVAELTAKGNLGEARYLRISGNDPDVSFGLLGGLSDSEAPRAELASVTHIAKAGGTSSTFTIDFSDNVAVNAASIDRFDVRVTGPDGFSVLATAVVSSGLLSGPSLSADYRVAAPGGAWDVADSGTYSIEISPNQVTDLNGNAVAAQTLGTFEVSISPTAPVAVGALYFALEEQTLLVDASSGLLSQNAQDSSDSLEVRADSEPEHGTLILQANGSFVYTPETDFAGVDSFTYHLAAGSLNSNTATVTIAVNNINDAPRVIDDVFKVIADRASVEGDPINNVLTNDTDPDQDALQSQLVSGPNNGLLTLNLDGTFVYVPNADFVGTDSFRYRASDGRLESNEARVTINVVESLTGPSADLTGDGFVDFDDLAVLLAHWNEKVTALGGNLYDPADSRINFDDLAVLLSEWTGPGPTGTPRAATAGDRADLIDGSDDSPREVADQVFDELGSRQRARRARHTLHSAAPPRPIDSSADRTSSHRRTPRRLPAVEVDAAFEGFLSRHARHGRAARRRR